MNRILSLAIRSIFVALLLIQFQYNNLLAEDTIMTIGTGNITGVYHGAGSAAAKMQQFKKR